MKAHKDTLVALSEFPRDFRYNDILYPKGWLDSLGEEELVGLGWYTIIENPPTVSDTEQVDEAGLMFNGSEIIQNYVVVDKPKIDIYVDQVAKQKQNIESATLETVFSQSEQILALSEMVLILKKKLDGDSISHELLTKETLAASVIEDGIDTNIQLKPKNITSLPLMINAPDEIARMKIAAIDAFKSANIQIGKVTYKYSIYSTQSCCDIAHVFVEDLNRYLVKVVISTELPEDTYYTPSPVAGDTSISWSTISFDTGDVVDVYNKHPNGIIKNIGIDDTITTFGDYNMMPPYVQIKADVFRHTNNTFAWSIKDDDVVVEYYKYKDF